ncbi:hypothetical protein [Georgenia sp. AZ-5]|uniref:hypothetical protein n=1 Tax=Georgenia sp. AZ-5 TaxID=3367526 RepID=UPI003754CCF6
MLVAAPTLRLARWQAAHDGLVGDQIGPYQPPKKAAVVLESLLDLRPALARTGDLALVET